MLSPLRRTVGDGAGQARVHATSSDRLHALPRERSRCAIRRNQARPHAFLRTRLFAHPGCRHRSVVWAWGAAQKLPVAGWRRTWTAQTSERLLGIDSCYTDSCNFTLTCTNGIMFAVYAGAVMARRCAKTLVIQHRR